MTFLARAGLGEELFSARVPAGLRRGSSFTSLRRVPRLAVPRMVGRRSTLPAALGASPGGEARGRATLGDRASLGGGDGRLAHASAVGYGLRPSRDCAAVLGAQGFVARSSA